MGKLIKKWLESAEDTAPFVLLCLAFVGLIFSIIWLLSELVGLLTTRLSDLMIVDVVVISMVLYTAKEKFQGK